MTRIALNQLTTPRWSLEEDVDECLRQGLPAIGLWREKVTDCDIDEAIETIRSARLSVSSLSWAGPFTSGRTHEFRDAVADAREAISLADALDAGCLVVHSGDVGGYTPRHVRKVFRQALEDILPLAERLGVVLAVEPMHLGCAGKWTFLTDWREAVDLVDEIRSPSLKLAFDTYHVGFDWSWIDALPDLVDRIALVQLGDARKQPRGRANRCCLGDGVLPLRAIVDSLSGAGWDGWCELELHGDDAESLGYEDLVRHSLAAWGELRFA